MARWVDARSQRSFPTTSSTFYTYVERVDWSAFEFHVAPGAFAGVFPTHDGAACIFLCRPTSLLDPVRRAGRARGEALLSQLDTLAPGLAARCRAGHVVAPVRGSIEPPNYLREAVGDGWALVGDAGYHRDPITGHGITDAFRDAELLADAAIERLRDGSPLTSYQEARDRASRDVFDLTRELLRYPHPTRFVALQRELAEALDREADRLAARPVPTGTRTALAV
jgi:flavin-dependent dehydrogenase